MDEHVFKLIYCDEINESFRISIQFEERSFDLTILQKLKAWMITVDRRTICAQAKLLELDIDEYYEKIKEYIRNSPTNVDFKFINEEFTINCSLENSIKVKYFSCKLKEVDYSVCVENLIEKYYNDRGTSLRRLHTVEKERCELEKEKQSLEAKLNEFIERKKNDEEDLYNNFILVLNEKKKRIQHLNELLEAFRRGRPTLNPPVEVKKRIKKSDTTPQIKTEVKEEISESDSEDSYDTDEEKQKHNLSDKGVRDDIDKNENITEPLPSTSKCDYNLFSDDSPPRHLLPKRVKTESSVDVNISCKQTSKRSSENTKDKENNTRKNLEETPKVHFDTQELLDHL